MVQLLTIPFFNNPNSTYGILSVIELKYLCGLSNDLPCSADNFSL